MIRKMMKAAAATMAGAILSAPALAQPQAQAQIAVLDGDAVDAYRAAGVVSAEVAFGASGATLPKQALDDMLRAEAGKLGADAVILVTYQISSLATPTAAHRATGVAIRYTRQMATAPAALPPVPNIAVAPPAVMHAAAPEQVILSESDLANHRYVRIGPVSATVHQKTLITKIPEMQQLQEAMRAAAFAMSADAVINVKYKMTNGMFSKEGDTGAGIAVRFE